MVSPLRARPRLFVRTAGGRPASRTPCPEYALLRTLLGARRAGGDRRERAKGREGVADPRRSAPPIDARDEREAGGSRPRRGATTYGEEISASGLEDPLMPCKPAPFSHRREPEGPRSGTLATVHLEYKQPSDPNPRIEADLPATARVARLSLRSRCRRGSASGSARSVPRA